MVWEHAMLDLPVVLICRCACALYIPPNQLHHPRYPAPHRRGASRSSRTLGAGCDGRESIGRSLCARRPRPCGRRSRVVL